MPLSPLDVVVGALLRRPSDGSLWLVKDFAAGLWQLAPESGHAPWCEIGQDDLDAGRFELVRLPD